MLDILVTGFRITREMSRIAAGNLPIRRNGEIPSSGSKITADWLTEVLQPHAQGVQVRSVEHISEVSGTTTHIQIALTYNEIGKKAGLPDLMFLKLPPHEFATKVFVSLFDLARNETRFYSETGPEIQSLVPKAYYSKSNERGAKFALLFEDLSGGEFRFKDVTNPCTPNEAELVMRALGEIHSRFWNSPRLDEDLGWLLTYEKDRNIRLNRLMRKFALQRSISKYGEIIPDPVRDAGKAIHKEYDLLEKYWAQPPQTLIHGDPHIGNMYFGENSVGFLDWQVVRRGLGMRDVTYFLISSMATEERRSHQERLIHTYLDSLAQKGVPGFTFDKAWEQYRTCAPYQWIAAIVTAAATTFQGESVMRTGLERSGAALIDLDSVGALRSLA